MKKGIAFFDFDGTITTKDTLLEFIRFSRGPFRFLAGFMINSPYIIAYKAGIISNQLAKEKVLAFFFRGMELARFQEHCDRFAAEVLPGLIRQPAAARLKELAENQVPAVVVSASPENWIRNWAAEQQLELIATRLEVKDGKLTGRIEGHNCYGEEKVRRIRERYQLSRYDEIFAYGDSSGDKPMLALATTPFMKPFR